MRETMVPEAKVLVAQGELKMLDVMRVHLEEAGYDTVTAGDGVQAYEALEGDSPVAVILDLDLPGVSGFRLVKLIRRHPRWKQLPVIVTTSYAFEEVEDIFSDGIDGFVHKPFDPAELVSRLEVALSRGRGIAA